MLMFFSKAGQRGLFWRGDAFCQFLLLQYNGSHLLYLFLFFFFYIYILFTWLMIQVLTVQDASFYASLILL